MCPVGLCEELREIAEYAAGQRPYPFPLKRPQAATAAATSQEQNQTGKNGQAEPPASPSRPVLAAAATPSKSPNKAAKEAVLSPEMARRSAGRRKDSLTADPLQAEEPSAFQGMGELSFEPGAMGLDVSFDASASLLLSGDKKAERSSLFNVSPLLTFTSPLRSELTLLSLLFPLSR